MKHKKPKIEPLTEKKKRGRPPLPPIILVNTVTRHRYAKMKGMDPGTMRILLRNVGIKGGRFRPEDADRLLKKAQTQHMIQDDHENATSYSEAERRHKWAKAEQEELKLKRIEGTLVTRAATEQQRFSEIRRARDAFSNMPARLSGILAAESDQAKVFTLLTNEIHQILTELAL